MLYGGFLGFTNVNVLFGGYHFTSKEYTVGPSFIGWGKFSENYDYSWWAFPGFKIFRDHGHDAAMTEEAWQDDYGTYSLAGANLTDKKNRWFRSYKIQVQYQQNYWSRRTGIWHGEGNIGDSVNFKAVNKTYIKAQFEAAAKRIDVKDNARFEPKAVVGYLYDDGVKKFYLEFGHRLDVIELNWDVASTYRLLWPSKKN